MLRIWEEAARFIALHLGSSCLSSSNLPPWRSSCLWRTASPSPSPKSDRTGYPGFHPKPLAKLLWDALENSAKSLRSTRCVILKIDLRVTWRSPQRAGRWVSCRSWSISTCPLSRLFLPKCQPSCAPPTASLSPPPPISQTSRGSTA